mmetsp:Transcript_27125/g.36243  ORF Transcript_27125/g.36243 Transcript_27125/m.36243 type:complete len:109 (+) Transcript_27125:678-1004(+)|eukprot:CAMPEP_0185572042 /NCGR_PEP_ID=MMETSP0434-20130131/4031_1 /TAXON_ID=626734 ORGANISM="Favella taraikaensis, Strain Fe Narragansett Bay" /NCGR_SAMPLE_ID=MMETSP0434 /ASSEMBLY_ACC=CAM_ASM_000379 /LENGTH=108 /DNA_ID=CAMNT_0028187743 /DNA_START=1064 /DNA_END=1390 /DNA_ORIENTATION=+
MQVDQVAEQAQKPSFVEKQAEAPRVEELKQTSDPPRAKPVAAQVGAMMEQAKPETAESMKLKLANQARILALNQITAVKKFAAHLKVSLTGPSARVSSSEEVKIGVKR